MIAQSKEWTERSMPTTVKRDFVPTRNADFYTWEGNLCDMTSTNKTAWHVADTAATALLAQQVIYEPLFEAIANKGNRTSGDVLAHKEGRATYEKYLRAFVKEHLEFNSNITDDERRQLGLNVRKARSPKSAITIAPIVGLKSMVGGEIDVVCRVEHDQTRGSMHPDATAVECKYVAIPVGDMPPDDPDATMKTESSKKAHFIIKAGPKNVGLRFYGFFRWANESNKANSGPWGNAQSVIIA